MRILYISNTSRLFTDASVKYRCFNFARSLSKDRDYLVDVVSLHLFSDLDSLKYYDIIIFHRPTYNNIFIRMIEKAKSLNKIYIADYDDFIFNPEYTRDISIFKNKIRNYKDTEQILSLNKKAFDFFNVFLVSTETLKKYVKELKKNAKVLVAHNAISDLWLNLAYEYKKIKKQNKEKIIGYFSGTKSHNLDFRVIEDSLERLMLADKNIIFRIIGHLDITNKTIIKKTQRLDIVPFYDLPREIAKCDITIAPLEYSIFNEAKSCIKFLESLSIGVPCVASPIPDMLRNSKNGCIVQDCNSWDNILLKSIYDEDFIALKKLEFEKNKSKLTVDFESEKLKLFLKKRKQHE